MPTKKTDAATAIATTDTADTVESTPAEPETVAPAAEPATDPTGIVADAEAAIEHAAEAVATSVATAVTHIAQRFRSGDAVHFQGPTTLHTIEDGIVAGAHGFSDMLGAWIYGVHSAADPSRTTTAAEYELTPREVPAAPEGAPEGAPEAAPAETPPAE